MKQVRKSIRQLQTMFIINRMNVSPGYSPIHAEPPCPAPSELNRMPIAAPIATMITRNLITDTTCNGVHPQRSDELSYAVAGVMTILLLPLLTGLITDPPPLCES